MTPQTGTVYLVGAGPGDPDLLTVKARRLLDRADVVLHDSLVSRETVEWCADGADVIDVGKRPDDGQRTTQAEINRTMVDRARAGADVVRLKGGDPTVFGRGGEEAEHLSSAGVPFEVVPGVTSAVAAPAVAGVPVTHRDHASTLTVVPGHEDPTKPESALDWGALARTVVAGGTLVILMGVGRLAENVAALRENGVPASTPAAMVERATLDDEFAVSGTLDDVVERSRQAGVEPPAVTVVGDVVGVRDRVRRHLATDSGAAASARSGSPEGVPDGGV